MLEARRSGCSVSRLDPLQCVRLALNAHAVKRITAHRITHTLKKMFRFRPLPVPLIRAFKVKPNFLTVGENAEDLHDARPFASDNDGAAPRYRPPTSERRVTPKTSGPSSVMTKRTPPRAPVVIFPCVGAHSIGAASRCASD